MTEEAHLWIVANRVANEGLHENTGFAWAVRIRSRLTLTEFRRMVEQIKVR